MGIYSRDYVREPTGQRHGFGGDTPAVKWLIIINVVAFLLQLATNIEDVLDLAPQTGLQGQVWRFITYAFLHDRHNPLHIVFNMLGLWWFGPDMERLYGTREFTLFYLLSAVAAGVGFIAWELAMGYGAGIIGASGAVLAVMTLFATHYPGVKIYVYGIFPIQIRWMIALFVVLDLWPVLAALRDGQPGTGVAHAAHLIGILFGWLYRRYHWHLSCWLDMLSLKQAPKRWRQVQAKQNLKVFDPEPKPNLESEVDLILAKIHEHGSGSLTEREQTILSQASQQYKKKAES